MFTELKRRNVFKVGAAYIVTAWLILQVADVILGNIEAPGWLFRVLLLFLAIGFLFALLFAWAYELTPEGIRRESESSENASAANKPAHILHYVVIGVLALAATYLFVTREESAPDRAPGIDALITRPSVIVLPFANISGDQAHDYLAFGLTDELIAGLQRLGNFPVVSRHASLSYGVTEMTAVEFAQDYGASYLVEGSVNVGSDGIRVLANLSSTAGNQVWAERYQPKGGQIEILDISDELVSKVAGAVLESEVKRVQRTDRPPLDAWEHYVKGLRVVLEYDHRDYAMARQHLDQAVEIAPDMAEAWWALGELETMRYMTTPRGEKDGLEELYVLIDYFRKAHELSPFHAAACGCLGYMLTAVGRPDEARIVFEQAVEAKPLSPRLRVDYALHLAWAGRYEEAEENAALVLKLGSVSQDRAGVWFVRSLAALSDGNEQDALDAINRAIFLSRESFYTPAAVALLYLLGQPDNAVALFRDMQDVFPDLRAKDPVFYVTLKPIDDILAARREQEGEVAGPADVEEIYSILRREINE
ncbi:MAG: tetratricopeptide repeat protein [Gammaproteobacteria bacterium]|nr:tetratricopeptide repeat protein [Gammaproteobacteria bacterium]